MAFASMSYMLSIIWYNQRLPGRECREGPRDLRPAQPLFISLGSKAFSQLAYWDLETAAKPLKKLTRVDTEILSGWYTLAKL